MYKLSSLPIEILYIIGNYLDTKDLITMSRLNSWYTYWLSFILGERIDQHVKEEGWRIHIDILAKSYPGISSYHGYSTFPFSTELLLLSEYSRINPSTLTLEFNLCPIDDDGLDANPNATQVERSIVLLNKIKTNIDIVAYFAQISPHRRLQHVNQAGAAIINDRNLWQRHHSDLHSGLAVMGTGFKVQYDLAPTRDNEEALPQLIERFKSGGYNNNQHPSYKVESLLLGDEQKPVVISFDKVLVSPEWWIKQMSIPNYNNHESEYSEHSYW
ncbi:MAG: hypothetical protein EXX96DRAFT_564117 [Benjaminiella poitrasii]|nr:MAG: hypothetical protein EXX96DRAFT_564117 [Benjaminiella poitrasii]